MLDGVDTALTCGAVVQPVSTIAAQEAMPTDVRYFMSRCVSQGEVAVESFRPVRVGLGEGLPGGAVRTQALGYTEVTVNDTVSNEAMKTATPSTIWIRTMTHRFGRLLPGRAAMRP